MSVYLDNSDDEFSSFQIARLNDFTEASSEAKTAEALTDLACRIYDARRVREQYFSNSILGEPVWDMLLALFCFSAKGKALSVSGLCHAAGVPATTALRWTQVMEQKKLISRSRDTTDARRAYVTLTDEGKEVMSRYLAAILSTWDRK